jgi:toxin-antitoxin system PIN domain toxin
VLLVDANVLLYAVNKSSAQHETARRWLDTSLSGSDTMGFPWTVLLAFLRISTHPAVFPHLLTIEQAARVARAWLAQPAAVLVDPTRRHLDLVAGLLNATGTAGNLVSDAHLAALAIEHEAVLVSFDTDFGRFDGLSWERPAG